MDGPPLPGVVRPRPAAARRKEGLLAEPLIIAAGADQAGKYASGKCPWDPARNHPVGSGARRA